MPGFRTRSRFLFCPLASPGFTFPAIKLARLLVARGHRVAFATGQVMEAVLRGANLERIPRGAQGDGPSFEVHHWHRAPSVGIQALHIRHALHVFSPDVLIASELALGPWIVGEENNLPVATLGTAVYLWPRGGLEATQEAGPESLAGRRLLRYESRRQTLAEARELLGLPPHMGAAHQDSVPGDLYLLRSAPAFEPELDQLPDRVHLIGACLWEPDYEYAELTAWIERATAAGTPVVYLQQGRSFGWYSFWPAMMEVTREFDVCFIASTGRMDQTVGLLPPNVFAMPHAPQQAVLPHAAGVICSGNTTAVLGALTHGVPSLLVPAGGEQPDLAEKCQAAGVSLVIPANSLSVPLLRTAVRRLLNDANLKEQALRLRDGFRTYPGSQRAINLLESLALPD